MLILKLLTWRMNTISRFTYGLAVTRADWLWNSLESQHFLAAFMEVGLWEAGGVFWLFFLLLGGASTSAWGPKSEILGTRQILRAEKSKGPDSFLLPLHYSHQTSPSQVKQDKNMFESSQKSPSQAIRHHQTKPRTWAVSTHREFFSPRSVTSLGNENLCFAGLKSKLSGRCRSKGVLLAPPPLSHQPLVLLDQRKSLKTKTLNQPQTHRDVKYGIGNKVNNIVLTTYGTRWATYRGDRFVRYVNVWSLCCILEPNIILHVDCNWKFF